MKKDYISLFLFTFLVLTLSTLTSFRYLSSLIIVSLQDFILIALLIMGKVEYFTAFYVIFLATSFETAAHMSDVKIEYYGFKNIHVLGISNNLFILLIALVVYLLIFDRKLRFPKTGPVAPMTRMTILNVIAIVIGFFFILSGDNGSSFSSEYLKIFIGETYYGINTLLTMFFVYTSFIITKDKAHISNLFINTFLAIVLAECYAPYVCYYMGITGGYGGLLVSTYPKLLVPLLLLFASYYPLKHKYFLYLSFVVGEIIPILYFKAGSGKEVLLLIISLVFMLYYRIKTHEGDNANHRFIIFCIIGVISLYIVLPILMDMNIMFSAKVKQLYSLIYFSSGSYLANMESSPQVRVYEIMSILREYITKPWSIPFGKGFGGSFQDHYGYFTSLPSHRWHGIFSDFEFTHNYFYRMHELSRIPLTYGVFGIVSIVKWVKIMLKNNSPMALLGIIWVVLFINNSQTLACVLILGFVTAIYQDKMEPEYDS